MLLCATQDFRNAVAEFDYVFSRIPRNSVPVRTMGGPQRQPLSPVACELFEGRARDFPDPLCSNDGPGLVITHRGKRVMITRPTQRLVGAARGCRLMVRRMCRRTRP
jgi:hypothetical protein